MRLLGLDLSARETDATGVATYDGGRIRTFTVYKDKDIMELINRNKPEIVAIGAPLVVVNKPFRAAETELQHLGFQLTPLNTGGMHQLAKRAASIKYAIEATTKVIECYPSLTRQVLKISKAKELKNVGFGNIIKNEHEEDAIFDAITALFYAEGNYDQFGDEEEGYIILPKAI